MRNNIEWCHRMDGSGRLAIGCCKSVGVCMRERACVDVCVCGQARFSEHHSADKSFVESGCVRRGPIMQDALNKFLKTNANQCRLVFRDMKLVADVRKQSDDQTDISEIVPQLLELRKTLSGACIWADHIKIAVKIELHRYDHVA